MPPDYRRWDFIPNRVTKHGRVLRAETHTVPHTLANRDALLAIVEERNVLLPWKANHDIQPLPISKIQEPQGRHCVCPDSIYSCIRDQKKIRLHTIAIMKFTSALVNRVFFESSMTTSLSYSALSSAGVQQLTVLGLTHTCLCACTVFLDLFLKSTCESEILRRSPNPANLIPTRIFVTIRAL